MSNLDELCIKSHQFQHAVFNNERPIVDAVKKNSKAGWQEIHSKLNMASGFVQPDIKGLSDYEKKQLVRDNLQQSSDALYNKSVMSAKARCNFGAVYKSIASDTKLFEPDYFH